MAYLITTEVCQKQYTGSITTKFRARFNQYDSNMKLYGEGKRDFFKQNWLTFSGKTD